MQESFENVVGELGEQALVSPQGIYQKLEYNDNSKLELCEKLGVSHDSKIVLNLGYGDLRKGFDLFVNLAKQVVKEDQNYHFVWLGAIEENLKLWLNVDLQSDLIKDNFHVIPFQSNVSMYLEGADVMALTSREDPFPSVVLESVALGTPVVGFRNGGGYVDVLEDSLNGALVEMGDISGMGEEIIRLSESEESTSVKKERIETASELYNWNNYVFSLVQLLEPSLKKVSVVVPNYNYENHIAERLRTIFSQRYPVYEVIVLDDKSKDQSVDVIEHTANDYSRNINLIVNEVNSGNVFKQWNKGAKLAKGEFVWIAEADDLAEDEFLESLLSDINEKTALCYADSKQIDENDNLLGESYKFYFKTVDENQFENSFTIKGTDFIQKYLSVKNLILNASSVVFRKQNLINSIDRIGKDLYKFKVAGDWRIYVDILDRKGVNVSYCKEPLNIHRRHMNSVTHQNFDNTQLSEIKKIHDLVDNGALTEIIKNVQDEYVKELTERIEG